MAEILRTRQRRVVAVVLGAVALTLGAIALLFDWNWLRGPIERHLQDRSGREVRVSDLDVDFNSFLEPTVRLRGVYVQNAGWASSKAPMIEARELSFRFALSSLWGERVEVTHLTLTDANVQMERAADGRRNWRLRKPEDTGPGTVRVMRLEAHDSQLRFVNHELGFEFVAASARLQPASVDNFGLATRVSYRGTYEGQAFTGEADVPRTISFRGSAMTFAAKGHLLSRGTRVDFDGLFTDLFDIGPIDAKLRVTGPSLSLLYPFVRVQPPPSKPFVAEAQLTQAGGVYRFAGIKATIGSTPLAGEVNYDNSGERPRVEAQVQSDAAVFADVQPLMGMRGTAGKDKSSDDGKRPFRLAGLRRLDAHVQARARRLTVQALPPLEDVRVDMHLDGGVLDLKMIELRASGGGVTGAAVFDARADPPQARVALEMRRADLERLVPAAGQKGMRGQVSANLKVSSEGASAAALMTGVRGGFEVRLERGTISSLTDAKLGLDFGKVIGNYLRGEREIAIGCAIAAFELRGGVARSRQISLETEQTRVDGTGTADLKNDTIDFVLTPEPKNPGLFTRRGSLRIRGALGAPATTIEDRVEQTRARCAA